MSTAGVREVRKPRVYAMVPPHDDSTGDALYGGPAQRSPFQLVECRSKLVSEIEGLLDKASEWGAQNIVQFNPTKTQVCAFTAKKTAFTASPQFQNTPHYFQ
ncbi:jg7016 [Pararge aegeria aegeria]|uniref:Jg7016 protein n=1 Tax=Pararge aegeria aegeria TaxID=348720 RepID=A0A8S4RK83_9NEOP|nr:jg7016 [Pararge aegeria aegeria]